MKSERETAPERRKLLSIARSYRAKGYEVLLPSHERPAPDFLDGYLPDLIARSATDNVVVEVKRADAIRGSNDLVWLAKKIDTEDDWRLELVSVGSGELLVEIDDNTVVDLDAEARLLLEAGFIDAAFVVVWAHVEAIIASFAVLNRINPANRALPQLLQDLYRCGLVDDDVQEALQSAWSKRNLIAHSAGTASSYDVESLVASCRSLLREQIGEAA